MLESNELNILSIKLKESEYNEKLNLQILDSFQKKINNLELINKQLKDELIQLREEREEIDYLKSSLDKKDIIISNLENQINIFSQRELVNREKAISK